MPPTLCGDEPTLSTGVTEVWGSDRDGRRVTGSVSGFENRPQLTLRREEKRRVCISGSERLKWRIYKEWTEKERRLGVVENRRSNCFLEGPEDEGQSRVSLGRKFTDVPPVGVYVKTNSGREVRNCRKSSRTNGPQFMTQEPGRIIRSGRRQSDDGGIGRQRQNQRSCVYTSFPRIR